MEVFPVFLVTFSDLLQFMQFLQIDFSYCYFFIEFEPIETFDTLLWWTPEGLFATLYEMYLSSAADLRVCALPFLSMLLNCEEFYIVFIVDYWSIDAVMFLFELINWLLIEKTLLSLLFYNFIRLLRFVFSCKAFYSLACSFYRLFYCCNLLAEAFFW